MEIDTDTQHFLTINIKYDNAISLYNFKESLEGWYNQYNKHLSETNTPKEEDTLLIKEIKQGSIIITLISSAVPLLSDYNTIFTFYTSVKSIFNWLSTKRGKKPKYDLEELENIKKIVSPINTTDKSLNISINGDKNTVMMFDKLIVQKIYQNANEEIQELSFKDKKEEIPDLTDKDNVLLKFTQIEGTEKNNRNTKGVISELDKKSLPITFSEGLKQEIVHGAENPLVKNYIVNIKEHRKNNEIISYTVLNIVDSYYDETEKDLFSDT